MNEKESKKKKYEFNNRRFLIGNPLLRICFFTEGIRYTPTISNGNNAGKRPSRWRVKKSTGSNNVKLGALNKVTLK
ncbi:hypothetical protein GCM10010954_11520 [Halobacillus andaensis]|uniref:Uncharacterized protein n=1 Tax=Halobacillus andaensis TaxID=1176239 RepID=A0A917EUA5_HALAA|nr:hypothetical protein GCM10010954_11520 [Halobacillus andaensis]